MLNYGNLSGDVKRTAQVENLQGLSIDEPDRGGQICSSVEVTVIVMERRDLAT